LTCPSCDKNEHDCICEESVPCPQCNKRWKQCICSAYKIDKAKTEELAPGVEQVPFEGIEAIGAIFSEGEIKYGVDNWKKGVGDEAYQVERTRHAIRHLMLWANGDRSEPHLAKVGWFCVTQLWTEKQGVKKD